MNSFSIVILFSSLFLIFILLKTARIVPQRTEFIIERLGKFNKVSKAGLNFKIPIIDTISGNVNLRVRELPVEVETKTKPWFSGNANTPGSGWFELTTGFVYIGW